MDHYYSFVDKFAELQRHESKKGDRLAIILNRKRKILKKHGIEASEYSWNVPLNVLDEILKECRKNAK